MKKTVLSLACVLAAALTLKLSWEVRQAVPVGLPLRDFEAFYGWSRDLGAFPLPEGSNEVTVRVNDAGAMHSGNHWVWVIASSPGEAMGRRRRLPRLRRHAQGNPAAAVGLRE